MIQLLTNWWRGTSLQFQLVYSQLPRHPYQQVTSATGFFNRIFRYLVINNFILRVPCN